MTLERIEAALDRLEAATQSAPSGLAKIQASNQRLREAVGTSVSQIDALIARHGTKPRT